MDRTTDGPTDRPTNGQTLLQRCLDASKNSVEKTWIFLSMRILAITSFRVSIMRAFKLRIKPWFLDASTHLNEGLSIHPSVRPSFHPSVCPLRFFLTAENVKSSQDMDS